MAIPQKIKKALITNEKIIIIIIIVLIVSSLYSNCHERERFVINNKWKMNLRTKGGIV